MGEELLQLLHLGAYCLGCSQSIAGGRKLHTNARRRMAVQTCRCGIALATDFHASHILEAYGGAVCIGTQNDVLEGLHRTELAGDGDRSSNGLARQAGQITNGATGYLRILCADGTDDLSRRQLEAFQLAGVQPDAHGLFGTKQLHLAYARQALDFWHHVARCVVTQAHHIPFGV